MSSFLSRLSLVVIRRLTLLPSSSLRPPPPSPLPPISSVRSLVPQLVQVNNPDKIVFVGEALVGNEAVDQLTKFNRSLRDFSGGAGNPRGIDGMILTK